MSEKELRAKYGGKLAKAINRAIRAEIPGGNAALDKLTALAGPARHSGWYDRSGNPTEEAAEYFKHQRNVIEKMEAKVRERWGIGAAIETRAPRNRDTKRSKKPPARPVRRSPVKRRSR